MSPNAVLRAAQTALEEAVNRRDKAKADLQSQQEDFDQLGEVDQMARDVAQVDLDQARIDLKAAELHFTRSNLAVQAAEQAVTQALSQPAAAPTRGNQGRTIQQQEVVNGVLILKGKADVTRRDVLALEQLITRCYHAEGGLPQAVIPGGYIERFVDDIFSGGWCSTMQPQEKPPTPKGRDQKACAIVMGSFLRDCDPAEGGRTPEHRKAGQPVYCKVKRDPTRITFDYVDSQGCFIKYIQTDGNGTTYENVIWNDTVERVHAKSLVAFDRAEILRYKDYNRQNFLIEAQASLHFWYHIGERYERVPNLTFEPKQTTRYALYIHNLQQEFAREMQPLIPKGDDPTPPGL